MNEHPFVVIGAGPAGMAAALAVAEAGAPVMILDENAQPGGQIYRQSPHGSPASDGKATIDKKSRRGEALRWRLRELQHLVRFERNARVWGVFNSRDLAFVSSRVGAGGSRTITAGRIILAPGAYELVPPFPGWTLPGVFTPGGAQTLVKTMHVRPGRRALVVGTGPFLLVVALHLHNAGVEVVGVVEAARRRSVARELPGLLTAPSMVLQGRQYLKHLKRAGIPFITGHIIVTAEGREELAAATIAPCDESWVADRSRTRTFEVDTLCVGYGFIPRTQLAQLAGCRLDYCDSLGGWLPQVDENGRTSVPHIWSAGDGAGVAGAVVAELEGRVAGLAAAYDAGVLSDQSFAKGVRPLRRKLQRLRRFRAALNRISRIRPGVSRLAQRDTIVCRCEELTLAEVQTGIEAGSTGLRALKVATRLGMGPCQGRMCWPSMARWIAVEKGVPVECLGPISARPPIDPITLGELAGCLYVAPQQERAPS